MEPSQGSGTAAQWLLTPFERSNPSTALDEGRPHGAAWSRGNIVRPLIDGVQYFDRLLSELADTRVGDQIYFAAWLAAPGTQLDRHGTRMGTQLARALRAGATVHGLFWHPYLGLRQDIVEDNRRFIAYLNHLGGAAVFDQRVRAAGSHHQKFLVIRRPQRPDTDIAFVGGIDPFHSRRDDHAHFGDPRVQASIAHVYGERPSWHDAHIEVRGPAVADVEHCFRERWNDSTSLRRSPAHWLRERFRSKQPESLTMPTQQPTPAPCGSHTVQLLRTYPRKFPPYPFAPRGERSIALGYAKALTRARRLIYVEDQFLWSPVVAETFAEALRSQPELRLIAVLPTRPDKDNEVHVATHDVAHSRALDMLYEAGGDRVDLYELENTEGLPIYVHSKVCTIDDVWASVGSANLNRRSWTYDSELSVAVVDEHDAPEQFAASLRLRLWREHLGREAHDDADLRDLDEGVGVLRRAAKRLDTWHRAHEPSPRPSGHLRVHQRPATSTATKALAVTSHTVVDPDGRPLSLCRQGRW